MKRNPTDKEKVEIYVEFEKLLRNCSRCQSFGDQQLIHEAFNFAYNAHYGVARKTGEQYILHPLEVAKIVGIELKLGVLSVVCALIHDVVEDTPVSIEEVRARFGERVAVITEGLTKISKIYSEDVNIQAENFKKLLLTINDDIRVIFIKLADRLHNMRTLHGMRENKQIEKSGEVLYLFAPLAHRLGLHAIKGELEDLSFKFRRPTEYEAIKNRIGEEAKKIKPYIDKAMPEIRTKLAELNFTYKIKIQTRSCYSVWKQMQTKSISIENVPYLAMIRIIFKAKESDNENLQCWQIYGSLNEIFAVDSEKFKNYAQKPRTNSYQAIHGALRVDNKWIYLKILSERMDDIAERGLAVEPLYKKENADKTELEKWVDNVKEALQDKDKDSGEFIEEFKSNLYSSDIFIFTPKGQIKNLAKGATVLDFAYEIHSDLGNKCIGAKVNNVIKKPNYVLKGGEEVQILTTEKQKPQIEWLDFVVSSKALTALKRIMRTEGENYINSGTKILQDILNEMDLHPSDKVYGQINDVIHFRFREELLYKIGKNIIKKEDIKIIFKQKPETKEINFHKPNITGENNINTDFDQKTGQLLIDKRKTIKLNDTFDVKKYKYAKCCNPLPGDEVVGCEGYNHELIIHRSDCANAIKLSGGSSTLVVKVHWTTHKMETFLTRIKIKGLDRPKLLKDVAITISDSFNVNIKAARFDSDGTTFDGIIDLYVHSINDLNAIRYGLKELKGVEDVKRVLLTE